MIKSDESFHQVKDKYILESPRQVTPKYLYGLKTRLTLDTPVLEDNKDIGKLRSKQLWTLQVIQFLKPSVGYIYITLHNLVQLILYLIIYLKCFTWLYILVLNCKNQKLQCQKYVLYGMVLIHVICTGPCMLYRLYID